MTDPTPCPKRHHSPRYDSKGWRCTDCDNGVTASPLAAAFAARDRGMAATLATRTPESDRVAAAIRQLAATGKPFSANDARAIHGVRGGVVGATFNALRANGVIKAVGSETSSKKNTHGKDVAMWQAVAA